MLPSHHSLKQVLDHDGIFVLPTTVIGVQVYHLLTQPMVCKEIMQHTHNGIGALPHVHSIINQVVNLLGEGLTTHTKDGTLSGCQEVRTWDWAEEDHSGKKSYVEIVVGRDRCGVALCWW